jgi:hypothetical protein
MRDICFSEAVERQQMISPAYNYKYDAGGVVSLMHVKLRESFRSEHKHLFGKALLSKKWAQALARAKSCRRGQARAARSNIVLMAKS